jgi:ABC-type multidrug transport system fused ATPase/permease subunit
MMNLENSPPLSKVWRLVRPLALAFLLSGLSAIAAGFAEQVVPVVLRVIVNAAVSHNSALVWRAGALLAVALVGTQFLKIGQRLLAERAATRLGARLFQVGVHHLLSYPLEWFFENHSGAVQVRLERSSRAISELFKLALCDALPPLAGIAVASILMFRADPAVGIIVLIVIPILVALTFAQLASQAGIRVDINRTREEQGVRVTESVLGIEQVKLFKAERREAMCAGRVSGLLAEREYQHHRAMAAFDLAKFLVERLGFIAVLAFALVAMLRPGNTLGPGGVLMILLLYDRMTEPVRQLHRIVDEGHERWLLAKDFLEILKVSTVEGDGQSASLLEPVAVIFEDVHFRYPGRDNDALSGVAFEVPAGKNVAVVGPSGGGKSTVARLITGLVAPSQGRVVVGNQSAKNSRSHASVGMLSQDVYIFAGTVSDNIRYGRPDASKLAVDHAAKQAGLSDFIDTLPEKYDTMLGQRGAGLSGGQKQRLALARVLLQTPDVLVLDEPTSGLDADGSREFFRHVMRSFSGRTIIVITHNLENLHWADYVIMIESGTIREVGSPAELLNRESAVRLLKEGPHASARSRESTLAVA